MGLLGDINVWDWAKKTASLVYKTTPKHKNNKDKMESTNVDKANKLYRVKFLINFKINF